MSEEDLRERVEELEDRVDELEDIVDDLADDILDDLRDIGDKMDMQLAIWEASEPELYEEALEARDDE